MTIHWDDITNPLQARHVRQYILKEVASKNPYGDESSAIIMSEPVGQSLAAMAGLFPGESSENEYTSKNIRDVKVFRVKFIKGGNKSRGASEALPDFESLSLTNDLLTTRSKIVNLPICVAMRDHDSIKVGDQIKVRTRKSDLDSDIPSLQMCTMISVEKSSPVLDSGQPKTAIARQYEFLFGGQETILRDLNIGSEERNNAAFTRGTPRITWQQALEISQEPAYLKLGKWVQASEGTYESVIGYRTGWKDPITGKRIDQMTVAEVYTAMHGTVRQLNQASNAVGAYQWVDNRSAPTYSSMIAYFKKVSPEIDFDSLIFNATNQEAFAVYLFFVKRPILGNYLLGEHTNYSEAAQHAAYEWASIPIQYKIQSPMPSCNKTVYRGQSAYESCGGNSSSSRPGHGPDDLVALLKETQKNLAGSGAIQSVITSNNITLAEGTEAFAYANAGQSSDEDDLERLKELGIY